MKNKLQLLLVIFIGLCLVQATAQDTIMPVIKKAWNRQYKSLIGIPPNTSGAALYNTQVATNNLLIGAYNAKEYGILDSLAAVYLNLGKGLDTLEKGSFYAVNMGVRVDSFQLKNTYYMWIDTVKRKLIDTTIYNPEEGILNSAQFCYLLSKATKYFLSIPNASQYSNIQAFLNFYPNVLQSHYSRWVIYEKFFQTRAWGGIEGRFNHHKFLEKMKAYDLGDDPKYCNAVNDIDIWVIAGLVEFVAAYDLNNAITNITNEEYSKYKAYFPVACSLLEDRMKESKLTNLEGEEVTGLNFDLRIWNNHKDMLYSKYDKPEYPTKFWHERRKRKIGWDLSHATRFVHVFNTLYMHKNVTNSTFPSKEQMEQLSNQFVYGVFNKDFKFPAFANYMDGTNGWYRVGYGGREGFGYGPNDLSFVAITGGYCFWGAFNQDIVKLRNALWTMINSTDEDVVQHRNKTYGSYFNKFERTKPMEFNPKSGAGATNLTNFLSTYYLTDYSAQ